MSTPISFTQSAEVSLANATDHASSMPCMTPGTPQYDWTHRYICRKSRSDERRKRAEVFPGAIIVPPRLSFAISGLPESAELPGRPRRVPRYCIQYYDTGVSIAAMTKHSPVLAETQSDYGNSGSYSMTHHEERVIREDDRCWNESEEPAYCQLVLWPCYVGFSVAAAYRWSNFFRCMTFGWASSRHQSLRRTVMAMLLYHRLKQETLKGEDAKRLGFLRQPGILVSSSKVQGRYACATYDSLRISLMLHDGSAARPWSYSHPFGLAMGSA